MSDTAWPDLLAELHRQLDPIASDVRDLAEWTRQHERWHTVSRDSHIAARKAAVRIRWTSAIAVLALAAAIGQAVAAFLPG